MMLSSILTKGSSMIINGLSSLYIALINESLKHKLAISFEPELKKRSSLSCPYSFVSSLLLTSILYLSWKSVALLHISIYSLNLFLTETWYLHENDILAFIRYSLDSFRLMLITDCLRMNMDRKESFVFLVRVQRI